MNLWNILKYIAPSIGLLLGLFGVNDFQGIQSGAYGADVGNYAILGGKGLGSVVMLILGAVATYKTTGKFPGETVAELGALQTLWYTLAADGDKVGLELLGPLTDHVVDRKSAKTVPKLDNELLDQLTKELSKRLGVQ